MLFANDVNVTSGFIVAKALSTNNAIRQHGAYIDLFKDGQWVAARPVGTGHQRYMVLFGGLNDGIAYSLVLRGICGGNITVTAYPVNISQEQNTTSAVSIVEATPNNMITRVFPDSGSVASLISITLFGTVSQGDRADWAADCTRIRPTTLLTPGTDQSSSFTLPSSPGQYFLCYNKGTAYVLAVVAVSLEPDAHCTRRFISWDNFWAM